MAKAGASARYKNSPSNAQTHKWLPHTDTWNTKYTFDKTVSKEEVTEHQHGLLKDRNMQSCRDESRVLNYKHIRDHPTANTNMDQLKAKTPAKLFLLNRKYFKNQETS